MTKVALVLTVKNETRLLRANLLYHCAIGAEHIFVYFDDTTDNGRTTIADLDFVTFADSVAAEAFKDMPYLEKFTSQANEHHTARQCLNMYDALLQCKAAGYDWLVSLDADELVCTTADEVSDMEVFFSNIPTAIDVVYLQTREVLSQRDNYNLVFKEETWFKRQRTFANRFEAITKKIYNPFSKKNKNYSYWLGQHLGKGAVRVNRDIIPKNVHRYTMRNGDSVQAIQDGFVLHYHIYDAQDFIKKFTNFSNRADTFLSGTKVNSLKLLLRDVVNKSGMSPEELQVYFEQNLLFSEREVKLLKKNTYLLFFKRNPTPLQEITSAQKVFTEKINRT